APERAPRSPAPNTALWDRAARSPGKFRRHHRGEEASSKCNRSRSGSEIARKSISAYQVNCSVKFISGCPPSEAVRGSEFTFPNVCGFLKSTLVVGGLKLYVLSAFWKSHRSCILKRSLSEKFFCAEPCAHCKGVPVTILRPACPGVK